jgi:hypothetical protein
MFRILSLFQHTLKYVLCSKIHYLVHEVDVQIQALIDCKGFSNCQKKINHVKLGLSQPRNSDQRNEPHSYGNRKVIIVCNHSIKHNCSHFQKS